MMSPGTRSRRGISRGIAVPNHCSRHVDHRLELRSGGAGARLLEEAQRDAQHDHARHDASGAWVAGSKGNRGKCREQNDQRIAKDDQQTEEPAALPFLRNYIRSRLSRPVFGLPLRQTFAGGAQRTKQFIAVFPRCIEYSRGDTNVMVFRFRCRRRLIRGRKSRRSASGLRVAVFGHTDAASVMLAGFILRHSDDRWFRGWIPQYTSGARVSHAVI